MNELQENKETIEVNTDDVIDSNNVKAKIKKVMIAHKIERFISDFELLIITAIYITLSLTVKGPIGIYKLNGWGFWWILYLALPLGPQIYKVFKNRNPNSLPIFIIVLVSFLLIGLLIGKWHPYWALFFIVPIYHTIMWKIVIRKIKKNHIIS